MSMPKRILSMRSSSEVSEDNTRVVVSRRLAWIAAPSGMTEFLSSIKSPRWQFFSAARHLEAGQHQCSAAVHHEFWAPGDTMWIGGPGWLSG